MIIRYVKIQILPTILALRIENVLTFYPMKCYTGIKNVTFQEELS